jgi:ribonuclease HI
VGELAAMAYALKQLPQRRYRSITLLTRNKAAVLTLRNPQQQSGQEHVCSIYKSIRKLKRENNVITVVWLPSDEDDKLWIQAKQKAKEATRQGTEPQTQLPRVKSTTQRGARQARYHQKLARKCWKTLQESRHSIAGQTHSKVVRPADTERSQRACPIEDRDGKTKLVFVHHQSRTIRPMRLRTGARDSRTLSLSMQKMDRIPNRDAAMHRHA